MVSTRTARTVLSGVSRKQYVRAKREHHACDPVNPPQHNVPSTPRPEAERANRPAPRVEQHTEEKRQPRTEEKPAEHPKGEKREEGREKEKKQ
jgi:hypothetical protein